jgi:hypothetical protein
VCTQNQENQNDPEHAAFENIPGGHTAIVNAHLLLYLT